MKLAAEIVGAYADIVAAAMRGARVEMYDARGVMGIFALTGVATDGRDVTAQFRGRAVAYGQPQTYAIRDTDDAVILAADAAEFGEPPQLSADADVIGTLRYRVQ